MKLLMFAGAGSVGKTVLMEKCKSMAEERGIRVKTHHSSTRQTYAAAGLTNESDALKDPVFNREFQHTVMQDNIDQLHAAVSAARDSCEVDLFITDRAPYDYAGYYFSTFRESLDLAMIEAKRKKCDDAMLRLAGFLPEIQVIMLPYPTSWAKDTESSDGWRADKTGKNFVWSCVVEAELADAQRRLTSRDAYLGGCCISIDRLPSFMERGSVETRAVGVLAQLFAAVR
jgi:thymidylate kinase